MEINPREEHTKEKTLTPPKLLESEKLVLHARPGIPASAIYFAALVTFLPPFVWGLIVILLYRFSRKNDGIWLTNRRLIDWTRSLGARYWEVESIPLSQIAGIRFAQGVARGSGITPMIDRLLGVGNVEVLLRAGGTHLLTEVKNPRQLIEKGSKLLAG